MHSKWACILLVIFLPKLSSIFIGWIAIAFLNLISTVQKWSVHLKGDICRGFSNTFVIFFGTLEPNRQPSKRRKRKGSSANSEAGSGVGRASKRKQSPVLVPPQSLAQPGVRLIGYIYNFFVPDFFTLSLQFSNVLATLIVCAHRILICMPTSSDKYCNSK